MQSKKYFSLAYLLAAALINDLAPAHHGLGVSFLLVRVAVKRARINRHEIWQLDQLNLCVHEGM